MSNSNLTYDELRKQGESGYLAIQRGDFEEAVKSLRKTADSLKSIEEYWEAGEFYKLLGDAYLGLYDAISNGEADLQDVDDRILHPRRGRISKEIDIIHSAEDSYYRARTVLEVGGYPRRANRAYYHEKRAQGLAEKAKKKLKKTGTLSYVSEWKSKSRTASYYGLRIFSWTCRYGESPLRFLRRIVVPIIFIFTIFYWLGSFGIASFKLGGIEWKPGWWGMVENFFTSLYFSVITFATLGYGDIHPANLLTRILSIMEVTLGYIFFGFFVAMLTRKIGRV